MQKKESEQKGTPIDGNTFQDLQCIQRIKTEEAIAPLFLFINYILYVTRPKMCLLAVSYRFQNY